MAVGKDRPMPIKIIGALLIIGCCGGFGILLARNHRREVKLLYELLHVFDVMSSELEYRLTPVPELCRLCAQELSQPLCSVFKDVAQQLELQTVTDAAAAMEQILRRDKHLPAAVSLSLHLLGQTLGRFDLNGQLRGLRHCTESCRHELEELEHNQHQRLRTFQTLGFCAGAALAILLF